MYMRHLDLITTNTMNINEMSIKEIEEVFYDRDIMVFDDGEEGSDCFDDGSVHINKGKFRICFESKPSINDRFMDSEVRKFREIVDSKFD